MTQKHNPPPSHEDWNFLPLPVQVYLVWHVFFKAHLPKTNNAILKYIKRVDLWLFPPAAFIACYKAISQIIPAQHPMAYITNLGTSFMSATLTLLLLRPRCKRFRAFSIKTMSLDKEVLS
jgi:hypothetical protein